MSDPTGTRVKNWAAMVACGNLNHNQSLALLNQKQVVETILKWGVYYWFPNIWQSCLKTVYPIPSMG